MKVPLSLTDALDESFENDLAAQLVQLGYLDDPTLIHNRRFISRSVLPHLERFMELFNRRASGATPAADVQKDEKKGSQKGGQKIKPLARAVSKSGEEHDGLNAYWANSSNPENLRLAYILSFFPTNLFRSASIGGELSRLGYRFPFEGPLRALELGAGPASASLGLALSQKCSPWGLPQTGNWALIEQDRLMLRAGSALLTSFSKKFFALMGTATPAESLGDTPTPAMPNPALVSPPSPAQNLVAGPTQKPKRYKKMGFNKNQSTSEENLLASGWETREFIRKLDWSKTLLPRTAPRFQLMLTSYVLNEADVTITDLAERWLELFDRHLEEEGLVILIEPALRLQSRKLLELRKAFLASPQFKTLGMQVLLPCLGHQNCGALADAEDWCHEEVSWWRPKFVKLIDDLAGMDRKTLPFSYLVLTKSTKDRTELLPALQPARRPAPLAKPTPPLTFHRLVSPAFSQGQDREFFLCGTEGKRRARLRVLREERSEIDRGTILVNAQVRGESNASRVDHLDLKV